MLIDGTVKVAKGATLTITPGTDIAFVRRDADADGLGDAVLAVEGRLMALGTRAAADPFSQRRRDIRSRATGWKSASTSPRRCTCVIARSAIPPTPCMPISPAAWSRTAPFITTSMAAASARPTFTFRNNLIEHNQGKGINFRNSSVDAHHNILRYNGSGMFLFENDRDFDIHHNNFYGNLDNFRLGDFYTGDVTVHDNWWGTADRDAAQATIYDRSKDPEIGQVTISPAAKWVAGDRPARCPADRTRRGSYATDGYIDADLVADESRLYVASWDGDTAGLIAQGWPGPLEQSPG